MSSRNSSAYRLHFINKMQCFIGNECEIERELIASWVEEMCQGLDADTIAEAIRNGGNDAMDNFRVSK